MNDVKILTIDSDLGAGVKGAKLGPSEILKILQKQQHKLGSVNAYNIIAEPNTDDDENFEFAKNISAIVRVQKNIVNAVQQILKENSFPLIISGDHSNGAGAIAAVKDFYPDKKIGVIWIDAHADLHTPYTTPSGNVHGMPLAVSLGIGKSRDAKNKIQKTEEEFWFEMQKLGSNKIAPKISPKDLVFIGIRDLEPEEQNIIINNNIKCFKVDEVRTDLKNVVNNTLNHLAHCDYILVSFDVDSLDPSVSSGTGTPVPIGLKLDDALFLLKSFLENKKILALEITEVNPILDRINPMEIIAASLLMELF